MLQRLQWTTWIEMSRRQVDADRLQFRQEGRPDACRSVAPMNGAVLLDGLPDEAVDFLHLDDFALHTGNLRYADHATMSVGQALKLDDDSDRRCDLVADARQGHRHARHADHLLEPP